MLRAEGKTVPDPQAGSLGTSGADRAVVSAGAAAADPLPYEPAPPDSTPPADTAALARALEWFYRHGRDDAGPADQASKDWPALLHPYRDLTRIRHPYPLCLGPADGAEPAVSLSALLDRALADLGREGDEGERLKHALYRLEAALRALAEAHPGERLGTLWERAAARLIAAAKGGRDKQQALGRGLAAARAALALDGELVACGGTVPRRLLAATLAAWWPQHAEPWRERLDPLIVALENVLRADLSHSPEAMSSGQLRESVGPPAEADMDFDKMSDLLRRAHLRDPLPAARRERLERTLATLRALRPLFEPAALATKSPPEQPFALAPLEDCAAAAAAQRLRTAAMVDLGRAVRVAELELANRYRPRVHDGFFEAFGAANLSAEELTGAPPVVVHLTQAELAGGNAQALLELLASGVPIKVVLALDDLVGEDVARAPPWPVRLALQAMAFNDVYVLQCAVSRPDLLQAGFRAGLDYPGPALFAVYTGAGEHARLPPYLDAAAAADCRAFAAFRFDPGAGATLAERVALLETPGAQPWPREALRYRSADGAECESEVAFTPADFLFCDHRLAGAFERLPPGCATPEPVPVDEFLDLDDARAETVIPSLRAVADDGELKDVAISGAVATAVARIAADWRALKETAGIDNSFAAALLAQQRERLEQDFAQQVARIEGEYQERLERDIGELTREIVGRIAARLLGAAGGPPPPAAAEGPPPAPAATPPPTPETAPSEAPAPAAEAPAEDDDVVSLDEPYIDTSLCTSCDDCTNMSPQIFAYDDNKQAYIKDARAGTYRELVLAAEKCPVKIIHPGKPLNPDEPQLEEWIERAKPFR